MLCVPHDHLWSWGYVTAYIYIYRWGFLHFRYLKHLVVEISPHLRTCTRWNPWKVDSHGRWMEGRSIGGAAPRDGIDAAKTDPVECHKFVCWMWWQKVSDRFFHVFFSVTDVHDWLMWFIDLTGILRLLLIFSWGATWSKHHLGR